MTVQASREQVSIDLLEAPMSTSTVDFVTLGTFPDQVTANLALSMLQDAGINAHLADEHTVATVSAFSGVVFIRLQVQQDQAERAEEVLEQLSETTISEVDLTRQALSSGGGDWDSHEDPDGAEGRATTLVCPECGHTSIALGPGYFVYLAVMAATLIAGLTLYNHLEGAAGALAPIPGLAVLAWGVMRHRRFRRRCRACDHEGPGDLFHPVAS